MWHFDVANHFHALFALFLLFEEFALTGHVAAVALRGDVSRKRKLLEKQKEGKKRMKMIGNVEVPQEAFMAVLKSRAESE